MRRDRISIFLTMVILIAIGVVMIYSVTSISMWQKTGSGTGLLKKQLFFLSIGFFAMFLSMIIDINTLRRWAKPLLIISVIPLVLVLIPGVARTAGGAKRWLSFFGLNYQPSEFVKIVMIIYMADFIDRKAVDLKNFWQGFAPPVLVLGSVTVLILMQPDLGTAISFVFLVMAMLFVAGARPLHIVSSVLAAAPFLYLLVFSVPYRRARIMSFLNPWLDPHGSGFQIIQSQIALGTGGFWGVGLGQGKQKLFYLPAAHTDFIFSIIGEELGFFGVACVILLFIFLIWKMARVTFSVRDAFGKMVCVGVMSLIGFSTVVNIGVSLGCLPTKGLPLPFISYGGSSLVFHMVAVGLFLNIVKTDEVIL
jgi:cell division protein FtsW